MCFWIGQSFFGDDWIYTIAWVETLFISLAQGWFLQDPMVIIVRNNMPVGWWRKRKEKLFAKYGRSSKYQTCEKFFLTPLGWIWGLLRGMAV